MKMLFKKETKIEKLAEKNLSFADRWTKFNAKLGAKDTLNTF